MSYRIPIRQRGALLRAAVLCAMMIIFLARIINNNSTVIASPISEKLWGVSQLCNFGIKKAGNSLDGPSKGFDGKTASCQRGSDSQDIAWIYTEFERTSIHPIQNVRLEIGFYISEWKQDDTLLLQASNSNGAGWVTIEEFNAGNPPPTEHAIKTYDLSALFNSPSGVNNAQIQLSSPGHTSSESELKIFLDGAALLVAGEAAATDTPVPTNTARPTDTSTPSILSQPTDTAIPPATATTTEAPSKSHKDTAIPQATSIATSAPPANPTEAITISATPMVTFTAAFSPNASPAIEISSTPTLSSTIASPTPEPPTPPTATSTPTPKPIPLLDIGASNEVQMLWGVDQFCEYGIKNPANSIDLSFNEMAASCTGEFAKDQSSWQFTLQHTTFTHISDVILEVRFAFSGWMDDQFQLEIFDGNQWHLIEQFEGIRSLPPEALSTYSYPVGAYLSSPEALNSATVRFIGIASNNQVDAITIAIDEILLRVAGGYPATEPLAVLATPASYFLALADAPVVGDPHGDQSLLTDSCAACHRSHISGGGVLRQTWPEESVCFSCHSSAGPGTNVLPAFVNLVNTSTRYFSHDVVRVNGTHQAAESNPGSFSGGNRHIECEDCHDPHNAARGASSAPMLHLEMNAITGVDPVWNGPGTPASYTWLPDAEREYQVCFKCHSGFTSLPSYTPDGWNGSAYVANGLRKLSSTILQQVPDSRDLAREFNPNQASFHPVITQGRNQNIPAGSFVNGWSQSNMVYCTDCHSNPNAATEGSGPHGSPALHILNAGANYTTVVSNGSPRVSRAEICFQCHNYDTYVLGENTFTKFREHKKHLDNDWGTTCYTCHDTHGSEQLHLINFDASAMTFLNGRNSQTAWYYDQTSGRAGCFLSCHGENHDPKQYTP